MLSAAFSRVDISDSLIVADAPAKTSLSFIIVAVVIVSIGVNPEFISEESTKETSSRPVWLITILSVSP
jgi:hypothetical protein